MATPTRATKEADKRLFSFWQLIGGEINIPGNINRALVAKTEETRDIPEDSQGPISFTPATSNERRLSEVQVIEVDLTTTDDIESDQEVCAIEPLKTFCKLKLQKQQKEEALDNLSKLFNKSLLAELTTEDTWMDRLRRVIEIGDKQDLTRTHCGHRWRCKTIAFW